MNSLIANQDLASALGGLLLGWVRLGEKHALQGYEAG